MVTLITLTALCISAPSEAPRERLEFIGFAEDEQTAAWRVEVEQPQPGRKVDRYTVIRIINTKSGDPTGHIRVGKIRRFESSGRPDRGVLPDQLSAENPMWLNALPHSTWRKAKREVRFTFKRLDASKGVVRLMPDDDSFMTLKVSRRALRLESDPGSPVGLTPVARLYDGKEIPLRRIRVRGQPHRVVTVRIQFFHSRSGLHVASKVHLVSTTPGLENETDVAYVHRMPGSPLATIGIGTMNLMGANFQVAEKLYGEMHPEMKDAYKQYVGSW